MNTAKLAAESPAAVTFVLRQTARANREVGASDLTYIETVHASGRVDVDVVGFCDGETVNHVAVRDLGPVDLARVTAARLAAGWSVR